MHFALKIVFPTLISTLRLTLASGSILLLFLVVLKQFHLECLNPLVYLQENSVVKGDTLETWHCNVLDECVQRCTQVCLFNSNLPKNTFKREATFRIPYAMERIFSSASKALPFVWLWTPKGWELLRIRPFPTQWFTPFISTAIRPKAAKKVGFEKNSILFYYFNAFLNRDES